MNREVYSAEECPQELIEAILNAEPSLESEELNYLLKEDAMTSLNARDQQR